MRCIVFLGLLATAARAGDDRLLYYHVPEHVPQEATITRVLQIAKKQRVARQVECRQISAVQRALVKKADVPEKTRRQLAEALEVAKQRVSRAEFVERVWDTLLHYYTRESHGTTSGLLKRLIGENAFEKGLWPMPEK